MTRGIVTLAGGVIYTLNAYILCRLLREQGCQLPIEWFYLGDEMEPQWIEFIATHIPRLTLRDLGGHGIKTRARGGWQAKATCLLAASFDELLFLDADSHPLRDPTYIFDDPFFSTNLAVLWKSPIANFTEEHAAQITEKFGVCPQYSTESGQMMFNQQHCRDGLHRAATLNADQANYSVVYGDKDLFAISFLQTNTGFSWCPHPNQQRNGVLHPTDFSGVELFAHLVYRKWTLALDSDLADSSYPIHEAMRIGQEIVDLLRPYATPAGHHHGSSKSYSSVSHHSSSSYYLP